jgi:hypothetical protein
VVLERDRRWPSDGVVQRGQDGKEGREEGGEYGKIYINMRGPGFPQLKLTREFPRGSQDLTPPEFML